MLVTALLFGCGYQLRGLQGDQLNIAISSVAIVGDKQDRDLLDLLSQRLQQFGVTEIEDPALAEVVLNIVSAKQSRRVLSVDNSSRVSEFELFYSVDYRVGRSGQQAEARNANARREITFDENQVLAKAEEEERLYSEMRRDVVNTILRLLQRAARDG